MRSVWFSMAMLVAFSAQAGVHDVACEQFLEESGSFADPQMVALVSGLRDGFVMGLLVGSMLDGTGSGSRIDQWSEWMVSQPGDTLSLMLRDQCAKKKSATMGEAFTQMMVDAARERGLMVSPKAPDLSL